MILLVNWQRKLEKMNNRVYLVGAGPGDSKIITVRGMELIKKADVIIYDRLVNEKLLQYAPLDSEMIYVGKSMGKHTLNQDEINELLVEKGRCFKTVVRLKGGDPFVFGRGGEEALCLKKHNIEFEIVPGISSAIGGLAYAGIPVTHRGLADSFHVYNGHNENLDFKTISKLEGTLVFLMGVTSIASIIDGLIEGGMATYKPAAIISWASLPGQRTITASLVEMKEKILKEKIEAPSLFVIGEVVKLHEEIDFFAKKKLFGKKFIVTRPKKQNSSLVEMIEDLGGEAIELPVMEIVSNDNAAEFDQIIEDLGLYNYLIFSSVNGVEFFFRKIFMLGLDSRVLGDKMLVAIGNSTAAEMLKYGVVADIVPESFVSESLVEKLEAILKPVDSVLMIGASDSRMYLHQKISRICNVVMIKVYSKRKNETIKVRMLDIFRNGKINYLTFTSPSTVKFFLEILGSENIDLLEGIKIISIGPITSQSIRDLDLKVDIEADEHSDKGLLQSILKIDMMGR
ncbi:MAG: uroporphyrinogen III methyltransferase / synthase [Fusobacteria bacterium]|nr:MAG: uroporphyrinogen III methyltransferase / synthase [Fusobacteriota bacterium]KAF0230180.1 MAG: uroporphyrinogen III methyltransferase [Fusobacteriota bacterium]